MLDLPWRPATCLTLALLLLLAACNDLDRETFPVRLQGSQPVVALAYAPSGERLFLAGGAHLAYSPEGSALGRPLDVTLRQLAVSQTHVYALAQDSAQLWLFDHNGACLSCRPDAGFGVEAFRVAASADGSTVVATLTGEDGRPPRVVRLEVGAVGAQAVGALLYEGESAGLTLSPDGALLLVSTPDGDVDAVDVQTGQLRWRYARPFDASRPPVATVSWNAGPAPLVGLAGRFPVQPLGQLDPATGALTVLDAEQRALQLSHDAPPLARTRDGHFLFGRAEVGLRRQIGALGRYDLEGRTFTPLLQRGAFNALALSPDGARLAVSRGTEIDIYSVQALLESPGL